MADAPSRTDRCLLLYVVLAVEFCAAVALMLGWDLIWRVVLDVKWWATTLQFVGALVASGGLLYAYRRASRPTPVVVRPGPAHLFRYSVSAFGVAPFRLVRTASPEDQLAQLEDFVNGTLVERFTSMSRRIGKLEHEVKVARLLAESSAQKALAEIETKIEGLTAELDQRQVLDLRLAIGGLALSAIGTFLQYFS